MFRALLRLYEFLWTVVLKLPQAYDYRIGQEDPIEGGTKLLLVVSINRKEYEKARLTATMRSIRSKFPKFAKVAVLLMDNHSKARSISSNHTHNPTYEKDLSIRERLLFIQSRKR